VGQGTFTCGSGTRHGGFAGRRAQAYLLPRGKKEQKKKGGGKIRDTSVLRRGGEPNPLSADTSINPKKKAERRSTGNSFALTNTLQGAASPEGKKETKGKGTTKVAHDREPRPKSKQK